MKARASPPGSTGRAGLAGHGQRRRPARGGAAAAGIHRLSQGLLRAAGDRGTGAQDHRARPPPSTDGRGEQGGAAGSRPEPGAVRHRPRPALRGHARVELHRNLHRAGGLHDRELLAAAQFACDREVWDRCINTSERTKAEFDFEQRFPTPFRETVVRRSADISLDPAYVYGLIRQESRFVMNARSRRRLRPDAGDAGPLDRAQAGIERLQRRPAVGPRHQHRHRHRLPEAGAGRLRRLLPLAAAAYNAGPSRSRAWRNGPVLEGAAWAESVPSRRRATTSRRCWPTPPSTPRCSAGSRSR